MKHILAILVAMVLVLSAVKTGAMEPMEPGDHDKLLVSHHLWVTSFYDRDYEDLVRFTTNLKSGETLKLTIMSGGGPAIPCIAMVSYIEGLKKRGVKIVTEVAGLAASAAALLWMTGDERIVHDVDIIMFHTAVVFDGLGRPVSKENLDPTNRWVIDLCDYFIRQYLLNILKDTELVNDILAAKGNIDEKTNMHWFTGAEVHKMGISTQLIEVL